MPKTGSQRTTSPPEISAVYIQRVTAKGRPPNPRGTVSFIVPTLDRPTLQHTVDSIDLWPGDELLIIRRQPPGGDYGHTERNAGLVEVACAWFATIDDDDWYVKGARQLMADAIAKQDPEHPVPVLFRMRFPSGRIKWNEPKLNGGNIGTPMMLVPYIPEMLHRFGHRHCGDYDFINNCAWPRRKIVWREEVIAELGHD